MQLAAAIFLNSRSAELQAGFACYCRGTRYKGKLSVSSLSRDILRSLVSACASESELLICKRMQKRLRIRATAFGRRAGLHQRWSMSALKFMLISTVSEAFNNLLLPAVLYLLYYSLASNRQHFVDGNIHITRLCFLLRHGLFKAVG